MQNQNNSQALQSANQRNISRLQDPSLRFAGMAFSSLMMGLTTYAFSLIINQTSRTNLNRSNSTQINPPNNRNLTDQDFGLMIIPGAVGVALGGYLFEWIRKRFLTELQQTESENRRSYLQGLAGDSLLEVTNQSQNSSVLPASRERIMSSIGNDPSVQLSSDLMGHQQPAGGVPLGLFFVIGNSERGDGAMSPPTEKRVDRAMSPLSDQRNEVIAREELQPIKIAENDGGGAKNTNPVTQVNESGSLEIRSLSSPRINSTTSFEDRPTTPSVLAIVKRIEEMNPPGSAKGEKPSRQP